MGTGKKRFWILAGMLLSFMLCAAPLCRLRSHARESLTSKKVRVVLINYDNAGYVNVYRNSISGYYVDYLTEIAKYTGWEYDFQIVSSERNLSYVMERGNYDLLLGVDYSDEWERRYFEYPSEAIGFKQLVVATSKEHPNLVSDDISLLKGTTIGVTATASNQSMKEKFVSFCYDNGIKCRENIAGAFPQGVTFVTVPEESRFEMLENGEIDAVLCSGSTALQEKLYAMIDFGRTAIYPVTPKDDGHLIEALELALNNIEQRDTDYAEYLHEKYFAVNKVSSLVFSEEENRLLQRRPVYTIALWDDCAPYGYLNNEGNWSGIAVDVFEEISRMTDGKLQFAVKDCANSQEALKAVKNGEADILGQTFSFIDAVERGAMRSHSYFTDKFYIYRNTDFGSDIKDARIVVKQDFPDSLLKEYGVDDTDAVMYVDTVVDALLAVNSGKADVTFALQNVADYYINYYQLNKILSISIEGEGMAFCYLYGDGLTDAERTLLNKCISRLDEQGLKRKITEYILTEHKEPSIFDYFKDNWGFYTLLGVIVMTFVTAFLSIVLATISRKSRRIYRMLYQDDITGGDSYLKFEEKAAGLIREREMPCYILFLDISSFKYINNIYGYTAGNSVLKAVEAFLKKMAGEYPVARIYADHFAAMLPYRRESEIKGQIEGWLKEFDEENRIRFPDFNVLLKIGIYLWEKCNSAENEIRQKVNLANYAADNISDTTKSEVCFYSMEMHEKVLVRQNIEKDMHRAMEEGEFVAFYQPKYDIVTNKIIGAEALVRWKHRTKGMISPGVFVPVFENNQFITEVDFRILEQVCELIAGCMERGEKLYPVSCNFSRLHFQKDDFVEKMWAVVEKYGVPAECIEIEITETVATDDFTGIIQLTQRLKEKGFRIAIDDFGSGYSCIQLLYKLPINVLKFDRAFVCQQNVSKTEETLNRSIIKICHENNISIVCEGVETLQQKAFIEGYGCRYAQGYLYSRPVDKEQFLTMLLENA